MKVSDGSVSPAWQILVGSGGSPFDPRQGTPGLVPTDRYYGWANVKVLRNGRVQIDMFGFDSNTADYGQTQLVQRIVLAHRSASRKCRGRHLCSVALCLMLRRSSSGSGTAQGSPESSCLRRRVASTLCCEQLRECLRLEGLQHEQSVYRVKIVGACPHDLTTCFETVLDDFLCSLVFPVGRTRPHLHVSQNDMSLSDLVRHENAFCQYLSFHRAVHRCCYAAILALSCWRRHGHSHAYMRSLARAFLEGEQT